MLFIYLLPPPFRRRARGHSIRSFRRKARGHSIRHSILPSFRPSSSSKYLVYRLLLQFNADSFETLQMFRSWSGDVHYCLYIILKLFLSLFLQIELSHFLAKVNRYEVSLYATHSHFMPIFFFKTSQVFRSCSGDVHYCLDIILKLFCHFFTN